MRARTSSPVLAPILAPILAPFVLASLATALATPARALPNDTLLAAPLDTSLAPAPPAAVLPGSQPLVQGGVIAGGEIATTIGSGGTRGSVVRLDSGLIGGNTRAFVQVGAEQGPRWHDRPSASADGAAFGVETALPHGVTVEVGGGYARDRLHVPGTAATPADPDRPGS